MARQGTVDQRLEAQRKAGGGIAAGSHPEFDTETPLDKAVAGVKSVGRAVVNALAPKASAAPKPIGNSAMDRHNARAAEYAMTEAERQKQLKRLDAMRAADSTKAGKR